MRPRLPLPSHLASLRTRLLAGSALLAACASENSSGIPAGLVVAPMAPPRSASPSDGGTAQPDARAVAGRPLPAEPKAKPTERCEREVTCRHEEESAPSWPYAAPFELCRPSEGKATAIFSAQETTEQRRWDPRACCYVELRDCQAVRRRIDMPVPGRPLRGPDRAAVVAAPAAGDAWKGRAPAPGLPDAATAERLAARWARAAAEEHASVAAFSRLSLELLALGAPPELLAGAHRAALDEVAHAEAAWGLSSAYAGEARGPGPLAVPALRSMTPAALAQETLADGVVGETLAAAEASLALAGTTDDAVRAVLARVADDEERHAALALAVLRWLAREWPSEVLPILHRWLGEPHAVALEADAGDAPYGWPSSDARAELFADVLREVVEPCVRAVASG